jgi:hypothetical protein
MSVLFMTYTAYGDATPIMKHSPTPRVTARAVTPGFVSISDIDMKLEFLRFGGESATCDGELRMGGSLP